MNRDFAAEYEALEAQQNALAEEKNVIYASWADNLKENLWR